MVCAKTTLLSLAQQEECSGHTNEYPGPKTRVALHQTPSQAGSAGRLPQATDRLIETDVGMLGAEHDVGRASEEGCARAHNIADGYIGCPEVRVLCDERRFVIEFDVTGLLYFSEHCRISRLVAL